MMGKTIVSMILLCTSLLTAKEHPNVLIFTRNGEGYVHDNIAASVEALQSICKKRGLTATVSDDPRVFTEENLRRFKAVVFSNTNNEVFDTDAQRLAFMRYIRAGGGFMGIHSACATERRWPWFWAMVGGAFVRHPELQKFSIVVVDSMHPATKFLPKVWPWEDECYLIDHLNPDIRILLAVDLRTVRDDQLVKFPGKVFGDYYPLAWFHEYDGGRQFYTALGHKIEYYRDPLFLRHLEGGLLWVVEGRKIDFRRAKATSVELLAKPYGS
ncbi:MAG: ThuA domain-containing protein [candidate division KSB1 bacterium]|nr:ThuA domain-containing protein [candidate division KSB1 bacterium]